MFHFSAAKLAGISNKTIEFRIMSLPIRCKKNKNAEKKCFPILPCTKTYIISRHRPDWRMPVCDYSPTSIGRHLWLTH